MKQCELYLDRIHYWWEFLCRHCPKSRSSVCPDYLNRLHDFLGVDPSNLRMAGVRNWSNILKSVSDDPIIVIFRWSAFSTFTQWSWILIHWQWSCMSPGEDCHSRQIQQGPKITWSKCVLSFSGLPKKYFCLSFSRDLTWPIVKSSEIPIGAGLGSSAALSVCLAAGLTSVLRQVYLFMFILALVWLNRVDLGAETWEGMENCHNHEM